ncbi:hypothetical protein HDV02_005250 [Globomyces sp. JEL0801]|nr:hypothetical protein HDV02_005250 [Globomyces sp. JEL0801]
MSARKIKLNLKRRLSEEQQPKIKKIKLNIKGITKSEDQWLLDPALIKETATKLLKLVSDFKKDGIQLAEPFMEVVDKKEYPDYFVVIENPIAFNSIQKNIDSNRYAAIDDFKEDVLLVFSNCKTYNQPGSSIYADADDLQTYFLQQYNSMREGGTKRKLGQRLSVSKPVKKDPEEDRIELLFNVIKTESELSSFLKYFQKSDATQLYPVNLFETEFTWTLLHSACYYGRLKIIDHLMASGADVEMEDTWYNGRALAWAAFGGHPKVCKLLLEKYNADKNAKNAHGQVAENLIADAGALRWGSIFKDTTIKTVKAVLETPVKAPAIVKATPEATSIALSKTNRSTMQTPVSSTPHTPAINSITQLPKQQSFSVPIGKGFPPFQQISVPLSALKKPYPKRPDSRRTIMQSPNVQNQSYYQQLQYIQLQQQQQQQLAQQQLNIVANTPSPFMIYAQQPREPTPELGMISNIAITAVDEKFQLTIPYSPDDPEVGFDGHFVS